jgi:hypothetical protein
MGELPPALPHGRIEEVFPDVFFAVPPLLPLPAFRWVSRHFRWHRGAPSAPVALFRKEVIGYCRHRRPPALPWMNRRGDRVGFRREKAEQLMLGVHCTALRTA